MWNESKRMMRDIQLAIEQKITDTTNDISILRTKGQATQI